METEMYFEDGAREWLEKNHPTAIKTMDNIGVEIKSDFTSAIIDVMEEYTQSKMPSEEEIKKAAAKHEAAMRADYPNIKEDDWYWNHVNEDFEAGVEWAIKQIKSK